MLVVNIVTAQVYDFTSLWLYNVACMYMCPGIALIWNTYSRGQNSTNGY